VNGPSARESVMGHLIARSQAARTNEFGVLVNRLCKTGAPELAQDFKVVVRRAVDHTH
jgi:hypothetical protein